MSNYPEHDKLHEIKDQTQAVHDFLEWAQHEKGIQLARVDDRTDRMYPEPTSQMDLLAEWAGIDLDKLEAEKRQMFEQARATNS